MYFLHFRHYYSGDFPNLTNLGGFLFFFFVSCFEFLRARAHTYICMYNTFKRAHRAHRGGRHALPPITHILARKGFLLHTDITEIDLVRTEKNEMDDVRRNLHINPSNRTEAGSSLTRSTLYFSPSIFFKADLFSSLHENLWHLHKRIFHVLSTRYLTGLATAYSVGVQDTSAVCAQFV